MSAAPTYIGRYAPSPTGRLHLGNLRTALLAWLHTRLNNGQFKLRMDDIDTPRVVKGSDAQILRDLEWLGLDWDGEVYYQSQHLDDYRAVFEQLKAEQAVYPCFCSRKDIQQAASAPHGKTPVYPNTCRALSAAQIAEKRTAKTPSWRFNLSCLDALIGDTVTFEDGIAGEVSEHLPSECGDVVLRRADELFSYQLTVVIDDYQQGITDVVRGADLLHSAARQIALSEYLYQRPAPKYWHVPLMVGADGQRLSKRDGSDSIEAWKEGGAERLVGHLAWSAGLLEQSEPIRLETLLRSVNLKAFDCLSS